MTIRETVVAPERDHPNTIERLNGLALGDALRLFVIADQEVTALIHQAGVQDRFEGGKCPVGVHDHWPLGAAAADFEFQLKRPSVLIVLEDLKRVPSRDLSALSEALAARLAAFRHALLSGKMQVWELEGRIPARMWARRNLLIDVSNHDVFEVDDRGRLSRLCRSVELRSAPTQAFQRKEPAESARRSKKRGPKGREVERILRDQRIDVEELGDKSAAREVAAHMKIPPRSASEWGALEKMVRRIFKEIGESP